MKKTIFTLIALLSALNINAQVIEIYENGRLINTYNNTPRAHFKVKFTELGNTTNIDGHEFVEIGGLKWATMNIGAKYGADYTLLDENDVAKAEWGSSWRMPTYNDYLKLIAACGGANNFQATAPETITTGGIYWIKEGTTVDDFTYNVAGALFVATEDVTRRVFFPAAGNLKEVKRTSMSTLCTYWLATVLQDAGKRDHAYNMYINESGVDQSGNMMNQRVRGFSVRPVSD